MTTTEKGVTTQQILDLIRLIMNGAKYPKTMQMFVMVALLSQSQAIAHDAPTEELESFDLDDQEWIISAKEILEKVQEAFPDLGIEEPEHAETQH